MYCVKATQVDIELTLFTEGKGKKNTKKRESPKKKEERWLEILWNSRFSICPSVIVHSVV